MNTDIKTYLATYVNDTTTLKYELGARDLQSALLSAKELSPKGFVLRGCVLLPEWR